MYAFGETFIEVPSFLNDGDHIIAREARSGSVVWDCTMSSADEAFTDFYDFDALDESGGQLVLVGRTHSDYSGEIVRYMLDYTVLDAATGEAKLCEAWIDSPRGDFCDFNTITVDGGMIYLLAGDYGSGEPMYLVQVTISDGSVVVNELQDYLSDESTMNHAMNRLLRVKDGAVLIETDNTVLVYGTDGVRVCQTAETDGELLEFTMFEGRVLTLTKNGDAVRCILFDAKDGSVQEDYVIRGMESPDTSRRQAFDVFRLSEDEILMQFNGMAYLIRSDEWDVLADINGYRAYNPSTGEFYLTGEANGHVPHRSLDELIALGYEILGTE